MSKKEKDENVNFDAETNGQHEAEAETEISSFEQLNSRIVECPEGTGKLIPKVKVLHLQKEFEARGKFAVPKEALDEFLGFTPNESINRAYSYTKKINRQFEIDDDIRLIKIGVSGNDFYTIDMS